MPTQSGFRRHLRGRIAFQANLSLPPTIPGLQPEVTHSIALQAKILLLCRRAPTANGLKAERAHSPGQVGEANVTPGHVTE